MPGQCSESYKQLKDDLNDIDIAIDAIKGPPRGKVPTDKQKQLERENELIQSEILFQSCYVMQYAAFELFVENLFKECDKFEEEHSAQNTLSSAAKKFIKRKLGQNHGASSEHIDQLFMMVGIPFITYCKINWPGKGNSRSAIRDRLGEYTKKRGQIAHGKFRQCDARVTRRHLNNSRATYFRLAERLEVITAENLKKRRYKSPYWG